MASADASLLNEFIAESREHLRSVESDFILLEKQIESPDPEVLNRIFRSVHTIKGSSGFFGLSQLSALTHVMESLLSQLRDGRVKLLPEMMDTLLNGIDILNSMVDDINNSNELNITEIESEFKDFLDKSGNVESDKITSKVKTLLPKDLAEDIQDFDAKRIPAGGYIYILKYNLKIIEDNPDFNPVNLVNNLLKMGDILCGVLQVPETDLRTSLPTGDLFYTLLFTTVLDPDLIGIAAELPQDEIQQISIDEILLGVSEDRMKKIPDPIENQIVESVNKSEVSTLDSGEVVDTVRIRVDVLDKLMMLAGELVLVRNQQLMHVDRQDPVSRTITQRLDVVTTDLQESIMRTRMQPIGNVFSKFNRIVRDLSKKLGKQIKIEISGNEVELDKNIIEALTDPLTHIIRNSCDHGIEAPDVRVSNGKSESGTISLNAYHEGGQINVTINDDGGGISINSVKAKLVEKELKTEAEVAVMSDKEILTSIFLPGFSTAAQVSDLSGRGVGMDVVKTAIEKLGGIIEIDSEENYGTNLRLRLPLTLAIIPSLIVEVGGVRFAIPQINLDEMVCLYDDEVLTKIECVGSKEVYRLRDLLLPMVRLDEVLAEPEPFTEEIKSEITQKHRSLREECSREYHNAKEADEVYHWAENFAVLKVGTTKFGLIIDKIIGSEEIVVKPMHRAVKDLSIYSGSTVLGDGKVALILDALGIARHSAIDVDKQVEDENVDMWFSDEDEKQSLLLFNNCGKEQFAVPIENIKRIEKVDMKTVEQVGQKQFITIDDVSTRIVRIEDVLDLSYSEESEEMYMLLPKKSDHHYGLLMNSLVDIGEFDIDIDEDTVHKIGVEGSALIQDKMTLMLKPNEIALSTEPDWQN